MKKLSIATFVFLMTTIFSLQAFAFQNKQASNTKETTTVRLDLNLATLDDLVKLPRIGPVIAQRILDYRSEHGRFNEVKDLMNVSGIGEKTFARLSELIEVKSEQKAQSQKTKAKSKP